jgi:hypothetical protein
MSKPLVPQTIPVAPPKRIPTKNVNKNKLDIENKKLPVCNVVIQLCILSVEGILTKRLVDVNMFFIPLFKPPIYMWCPQTIEPSKHMANIDITA